MQHTPAVGVDDWTTHLIATHCITLRHITKYCNTQRQLLWTIGKLNTLHHTMTYCDTLLQLV